jgi:hypothetical protein
MTYKSFNVIIVSIDQQQADRADQTLKVSKTLRVSLV